MGGAGGGARRGGVVGGAPAPRPRTPSAGRGRADGQGVGARVEAGGVGGDTVVPTSASSPPPSRTHDSVPGAAG